MTESALLVGVAPTSVNKVLYCAYAIGGEDVLVVDDDAPTSSRATHYTHCTYLPHSVASASAFFGLS